MKLLLFLIAPAAIVSALEQEKSFKHLKGRALVADDASSMSMVMAGIVAYNDPDDASSSAHVYGSKSSKGDVYGSKSGKCDEVDKSPSLKEVQDAVCSLKEEAFDDDRTIYYNCGGDCSTTYKGCDDFIANLLDNVINIPSDPSRQFQICSYLEQCWWLLGQETNAALIGGPGGSPGGSGFFAIGHYVDKPVCKWAEDYLGCDHASKISQLREVCFGSLVLYSD